MTILLLMPRHQKVIEPENIHDGRVTKVSARVGFPSLARGYLSRGPRKGPRPDRHHISEGARPPSGGLSCTSWPLTRRALLLHIVFEGLTLRHPGYLN